MPPCALSGLFLELVLLLVPTMFQLGTHCPSCKVYSVSGTSRPPASPLKLACEKVALSTRGKWEACEATQCKLIRYMSSLVRDPWLVFPLLP